MGYQPLCAGARNLVWDSISNTCMILEIRAFPGSKDMLTSLCIVASWLDSANGPRPSQRPGPSARSLSLVWPKYLKRAIDGIWNGTAILLAGNGRNKNGE